jgi:TRAP transporter TAXI family solute receptor
MRNIFFALTFFSILALGLLAGCGGGGGKKTTFVRIGTGGVTGVYYPTGGAIARLVNKKTGEHGLKASHQSTQGSVFNVNAVCSGNLQFGLVQSDRQYQAVGGLAEWKEKGKQVKLRSICRLHPEVVTLVAADNAKIATLADLKGKRVNIGNPGSGQRGNSLDVLKTAGLDWEKDISAEGLKAVESAKMLQDGRIDAFFYTVGHPSGAIKEATAGRRKVHFVPITGMEKLLAASPYYSVTKVPVAEYPMSTSKEDVPSIGVYCTLVSSSDVPEGTVYTVTKTLFENLEDFKKLHPALKVLTREWMTGTDSAPLHPGAAKYYREAGLKK